MVELTIADTGSGLTDEMRERLFLPYFSTKQRGTGLGLAIAAKIIQEHQGTIRAEKNEPAGAKFIVELRPASSLDSDPDTSSVSAFANTQNGNHSELKSAEGHDAVISARNTREVADDLASTIARGPK
jgi:two-component system, NtrC family, nitrogen regulation sensor histidine kinase NtrY